MCSGALSFLFESSAIEKFPRHCKSCLITVMFVTPTLRLGDRHTYTHICVGCVHLPMYIHTIHICIYLCVYFFMLFTSVYICIYLFCFGVFFVCLFFVFCLLGLHQQHMEVPRLRIESVLQLLAYTGSKPCLQPTPLLTATADS